MPAPDAPPCLHAWLAQTARRFPGRPAVEDAQESLTIAELYRRAQAVAGALVRLGLVPGARVGLLLDKSVDAVTAIYATLMAGGIYVPIPASWPEHRAERTLAGCGAFAAITAGPDGGRPTIRCIAGGAGIDWESALTGAPLGDAAPATSAEDPALVLFTSGSTGAPKGVTIPHRAVAAFVSWAGDALGIGPSDRILCPSSLNFDLSTLDVFGIAVLGAACVVMPESTLLMPRLVTSFAREARVTVWYSVPSILMQVLDEGSYERAPIASLRSVLFAGEVMPSPCAARLRRAYPAAGLWNLYGPTETNVVTAHRLGQDVDPLEPVPIGTGCPYAALLLDPTTAETAKGGRIGELLVGGASLMTGYWGAPAETERALVSLEGRQAAGPFYRTGDRVLEAADGTLWFVGRMDRQVKRRGVRIELGEIEAALTLAPGVAEAAVVAAGAGTATFISAFVAPREASSIDAMAVSAHCARLLPSYMMPDEIQQLPQLPRGSRGKIDYEALTRLAGKARL